MPVSPQRKTAAPAIVLRRDDVAGSPGCSRAAARAIVDRQLDAIALTARPRGPSRATRTETESLATIATRKAKNRRTAVRTRSLSRAAARAIVDQARSRPAVMIGGSSVSQTWSNITLRRTARRTTSRRESEGFAVFLAGRTAMRKCPPPVAEWDRGRAYRRAGAPEGPASRAGDHHPVEAPRAVRRNRATVLQT